MTHKNNLMIVLGNLLNAKYLPLAQIVTGTVLIITKYIPFVRNSVHNAQEWVMKYNSCS